MSSLKGIVRKLDASTFILHEIQRMLQYHFMNLWRGMLQLLDIMVHGSFSQNYSLKEKGEFNDTEAQGGGVENVRWQGGATEAIIFISLN